MKKTRILAVVVCALAVANIASAEIIRGIDINFVTIGNAGNAADTGGTVGCGAVSYGYRIGKYEVTNAQWNTFTDAAGAPTGNPSSAYDQNALYTGAQQPTGNVSWYETLQFCNYLTSGDKSKGAYQFSGNNTNPGNFQGINRTAAISSYGIAYVIPTENEWYKAAYYKPDGSGYSLYANGTNTAPIAGVNSNYNYAIGVPWDITNGTPEQNSTFDMMGNIWEWNESLYGSYYPCIRGGTFGSSGIILSSPYRGYDSPYYEYLGIGFRVASVPEPATLLLLSLGGLALIKKRR
jgi:formylglycine-generating enzyme required for sulfatase activity